MLERKVLTRLMEPVRTVVGQDLLEPASAHFTRQKGERDWLYICQFRSEPTALAIQQGDNKPRGLVKRVAVYQQGTYRGEPILNLAVLFR